MDDVFFFFWEVNQRNFLFMVKQFWDQAYFAKYMLNNTEKKQSKYLPAAGRKYFLMEDRTAYHIKNIIYQDLSH